MKAENPKAVVAEQAQDDSLWAIRAEGTQPISEAMLQEALRRLHAAVEGEIFTGHKAKYLEDDDD
jgi:hypothetical protein